MIKPWWNSLRSCFRLGYQWGTISFCHCLDLPGYFTSLRWWCHHLSMCHGSRVATTNREGTLQPGWTTYLQCVRSRTWAFGQWTAWCCRKKIWIFSISWTRKVVDLFHYGRWWQSGSFVMAWWCSSLFLWWLWREMDVADLQNFSSQYSFRQRSAGQIFSPLSSTSRVCLR